MLAVETNGYYNKHIIIIMMIVKVMPQFVVSV
jgi:hypothetical protein